MRTIKAKLPHFDKPGEIDRDQYVKAKTRQLREFGYNDLTEQQVDEQITKILNGEPLDVIGLMMEDEVIAQ